MDFESGFRGEWLSANGLGGYSSSTIMGCNTRKYHGLLVASLDSPVDRRVLLSKLDEEVEVGGSPLPLSTNIYLGGVYPDGYKNLLSFRQEPHPSFLFNLGGPTLLKEVYSLQGKNGVVISYHLRNPGSVNIIFRAKPLITSRGVHEVNMPFRPDIKTLPKGFSSESDDTSLIVVCSQGKWVPSPLDEHMRWYNGFHYTLEEERGYPSVEDLYCPGEFLVEGDKSIDFHILALGGGPSDVQALLELIPEKIKEYEVMTSNEKLRAQKILKVFHRHLRGPPRELDILAEAADSFIVKRREPEGKSIIAGYHWFSDFGRDTFISLPGLSLVTGRFDDARRILLTYGEAMQGGLIPNHFSEEGTPNYNGVDSSLWFIYGVQKYLEYSGDRRTFKTLMPVLKAIVKGFMKGNSLISLREDGLLDVSKTEKALTWMDANVEGRHATPRFGRVVEINALWYNAMRFMAEAADEPEPYLDAAALAQRGFQKFWNENRSSLYDYLSDGGADSSIRPNQVFALSLPYSPLDLKKGRAIIKTLKQELLTPYGLRSLERGSPDYQGTYNGDQRARDLAYHQGTVWSWLIGPFVSAYMKVHKRSFKSKMEAEGFLKPLLTHLSDHGVGSISEVFDGDPPHLPRGCISQAWSVAEVLRVYAEDILEVKRPFKMQ